MNKTMSVTARTRSIEINPPQNDIIILNKLKKAKASVNTMLTWNVQDLNKFWVNCFIDFMPIRLQKAAELSPHMGEELAADITQRLNDIIKISKKHLKENPDGTERFDLLELIANEIKQIKGTKGFSTLSLIPHSLFDRKVSAWLYGYCITADYLNEAIEACTNKTEKIMLQMLKRVGNNIFITNPNFKGMEPYYKDRECELRHSEAIWLEILNQEYDNLIHLFNQKHEATK